MIVFKYRNENYFVMIIKNSITILSQSLKIKVTKIDSSDILYHWYYWFLNNNSDLIIEIRKTLF